MKLSQPRSLFRSSRIRQERRRAFLPDFSPRLETLENRTLLTASISGIATTGGAGFAEAQLSLFEANEYGATLIGGDIADVNGNFSITYEDAAQGSFLYVVASDGPHSTSEILFVGLAGEVGAGLLDVVTVNELTTVSTVYALSQFMNGTQISGPSPGLDNAVATAFTLVDVETGTPAAVVSNENNGTTLVENPRSTEALIKMNALANMLAASATDASGDSLATLFALATPNGGVAPTNTIDAIHNIAQDPTNFDNAGLFGLSQSDTTYGPAITYAPDDWILALHFTEGGFNAPGRMAFDAEGNLWTNNNFLYVANPFNPDGDPLLGPGQNPSLPGRQITVLNPAGEPILGSPIYALGVNGSGYGTAIAPDGSIWIANYDEGGITKFKPNGRKAFFVPARFSGLDHPMGIAFDQDGNLWIANMGDPADSSDPGSVTVYFKGNPLRQQTYTGDIYKPFSVAVDGQGRVWAANSPVPGGGGVVILALDGHQITQVTPIITSDALNKPIDDFPLRPFSDFASPRTIAIDSQGNGWVANFESDQVTFIDGETYAATDYPTAELSRSWGLAVDGSDRIWVQGFSNPPGSGLNEPPVISVVQGSETDRGDLLATFSNKSLEHVTALQIDQSGNVWVANNWALTSTASDITGGDGVVKFIGMASPVKTPLIGLPETPMPSQTLPGDGNLDGRVDGLDYTIWVDSFGDDPAQDPPGAPQNGDYNDDDTVDGLDYLVWAQNFGATASSSARMAPQQRVIQQRSAHDAALEATPDDVSTIDSLVGQVLVYRNKHSAHRPITAAVDVVLERFADKKHLNRWSR